MPALTPVRCCPRCDFNGQGISYFRRPGHVGLLVGVSFLTSGVGGLVYWLARRKHRVCPNCGLGWQHSLQTSVVRSLEARGAARVLAREGSLPASGIERRVLGTILILVATLLIMIGFVETELGAVVVGGVMGAGGGLSFHWGWRALQGRRQALVRAMERQVLRLARDKGGSLTVTEVAAELDLSMPAAEKVLIGMDDGFRVRSEITDQGLLLYEFPEVQLRARLGDGESPA
jgi:uncharacterized membrane protein YphA (DoxX/SURF4 family)